MGVIKRGILGGVSGSIGNVVGSSWKGIAVLKAKPLSVANPKTAAQVAQRGKMTNVVAFSKEILTQIIKPLWDRFAQQQSGFNAFIKANIDLFAAAMPSPAADLVISSGKMESTAIAAVVDSLATDQIDIGWGDDSGTGLKLTSDIPYVVIVNVTKEEVVAANGVSGSVDRSDTSLTVDVPSDWIAGDTYASYLAFKRADGTVVSDTAYSSDSPS